SFHYGLYLSIFLYESLNANMGQKTSKITSQDRAILDLKLQRDKLKQYKKKLQVVSDKETEIAKEALRKNNKRGALLALKKKKYQQQLLEKTEMQLMNLEELTQSIEFALVEKDVLDGLKAGNDVLKEIHKEMSIEKVEKLMEDTADAISYQNEIEELLSGKITDEDEELEELLPSVPKTQISVNQEIKDVVDNEEYPPIPSQQKKAKLNKQLVAA
ncbi:17377_t:CDS:2, partial [Acaulospora morrowiae]